MYINCGYTDTILIVSSKKKYGRDKAVGYISFVVVVVVRLWSFGFAVPLFFVSFRERTFFALVSTTFTTTRCLERFLSLSLCVCVFFDVFCASLRGPLFVTPFPVSSFSCGEKGVARHTSSTRVCGGGGVTCRRHISSRSPRNRPRTSSASNRTNWLPFYLRRAVLSPLSKSPSRLVPNTFSRF